ncbi:hypothetical protein MOQ72_41470 [Saccharopolyspora sp. K220]|uniref:hypothetical protein n=1 Tax=Saccharopolyspora soli TaxID=2926618 RepID=UPI001F5AF11A|nr:hypothetical protein [Saccharopolyspora soli]MCI2423890.1 hypothetical protein [Saccharopolyspora soli]
MSPNPITEVELWDGRVVWSWGRVDGLPAFTWGNAPEGLVTLAQLHAGGLQRCRGQEPFAVLVWRGGSRTANLWRADEAVPLQEFTPRRRAALTLAYLAQHVCACGVEHDYYARVHGCVDCCPEAAEEATA